MFKIYVGNLDYKVKVEQLRELFAVYAPIEDLVIPLDSKTNRGKGFGIVMIRDPELGRAAVKAMQGKRLMGRTLVVNEAVKRKKSGAPEPISKAELVRNGPFGPRMYRVGDPRNRMSRNPRRGIGGASAAGPGAAAGSGTLEGSPGSIGGAARPTSGAAVPPARPAASPAAAPRVSSSGGSAAGSSAGAPARPTPTAATSTARPGASQPAAPAPAPQPAAPTRLKAQKLATPKRPASDAPGGESSSSPPTGA